MFCPECGKEIKNGAMFCSSCGTQVQQTPIPAVQETDKIPVQMDPFQEIPDVKAAPKKNKKILIVIIAVVAALVLVGAGIFGVCKLVDGLKNGSFQFSQSQDDWEDEEEAEEEEKEKPEENTTEQPAVVPPEAEAPTQEQNSQSKEEVLAEAEELARSGDFVGAMALLRRVMKTEGEDPDYLNAYDGYYAAHLAQEEAAAAPEGDLSVVARSIDDESIQPLLAQAYELRAKADAKWDYDGEIPGECLYQGYIYMEDPENSESNRLYLVFVMNATIKDIPIEFIYWVFFDDVSFDAQGNVSCVDVGTSNNDGYTVKTAFGSYYSYYGLDDYALFYDRIIEAQDTYKVVKKNVAEIVIAHPVSDTYN